MSGGPVGIIFIGVDPSSSSVDPNTGNWVDEL